ncbi:MAG: aldolase/citrate lyase family protein [Pirellulaceae bacterium]|jgi:2-dehydro-3-deoxyglucarate aldolase/4-hydroxy-2-oxoheptanedioate aldolase|nr:aldolase/citrate lyase family protein [Pirellulaceae bacterium]MDP7015415.1 aldolase/citrate lyase family protein [Pirellulaceae bacterium]
MIENQVKKKLAAGETVVGTLMFEFATVGIGRIAGEAGAEFAIYDMEHTGWSFETIRDMIAGTNKAMMAPFVRVPNSQYDYLSRVLDIGAMGVMVPMVESVAEAELIARSTLYPPVGRRGAAFGIGHDDYAAGELLDKIESANRERLIIAQIETAAGLEAMDGIAQVAGVDVLWVGQTDLTSSLGIPGQFDSPKFLDALQQVVSTAQRHGKHAGYMAMSVAEAERVHSIGFRCIGYSGDLWIYQQALRDGIAATRQIARQ